MIQRHYRASIPRVVHHMTFFHPDGWKLNAVRNNWVKWPGVILEVILDLTARVEHESNYANKDPLKTLNTSPCTVPIFLY